MPLPEPPRPFTVELRHQTVARGELLWRCLPESFVATLYRNDILDRDGDGRVGGRFDPTPDCRYPYCYVALEPITALAETILRDAPYEAAGRLIPRVKFTSHAIAPLEASRPLTLIRLLDAEDLAAARQDTWLVQAPSPEYPATRRWAHWLRECSERADGLVWPSRRHPGGRVAMLFGDEDRCGAALKPSPLGYRSFANEDGEKWLAGMLAPLSTFLMPAV